MFCLFCFRSLGCFCFPQEQPAVILRAQEAEAIRLELASMSESARILRKSLTASKETAEALSMKCETLEKNLTEAARSLEKSEAALINLQASRETLSGLLSESKKEYSALMESYNAQKKKTLFFKIACGVLLGAAAGLGAFAVFR